MKFFQKDYYALRSSLFMYMKDGYNIVVYKDRKLGLLEEPVSSIIEW